MLSCLLHPALGLLLRCDFTGVLYGLFLAVENLSLLSGRVVRGRNFVRWLGRIYWQEIWLEGGWLGCN